MEQRAVLCLNMSTTVSKEDNENAAESLVFTKTLRARQQTTCIMND